MNDRHKKSEMQENRTPIILCGGEHGRCVVFGWIDDKPVPGDPVTMYDARMVIYWPEACEGLFGLAANGPKTGLRLSPVVGSTTQTVWKQDLAVSEAAANGLSKWK